ncbi:hypothetical protein CXG81DRAFT_20455 [Caulochytrium protostelioides]|uniref:Nep1-domain-containing protein n=1 Tax=Caulochytrium protostelioides TaxID=1555241 RepID=A0A4P9X0D7_9FUNG|nr:Nep1-domain-containing protein [Caulochytrium protostelioides]RKO99463.1 hypothetical protein CXG81DRAFT_20455 [Caulochytrium protostelioides]|eukprot:RKO99463.1 hypothetical protein CXG81DRAFT_20455 [Caulochytrium protostelioides]
MEFTKVAQAPKVPTTRAEKDSARRLIVVISGATLETVKLGKAKEGHYQLLNCDDHQHFLRKNGKSYTNYRPDITHQCLLTLLDSPLNKSGQLQVYIHTAKNVLIEVNPHIRIPRTYKRFSGLMVQLLHKLSIHATNGSEKLLKVIKNPIEDHLPAGARRITMSGDAPTVRINKFVTSLPKDQPVVFFVGGMAHGEDDFADHLIDQKISISEYSLSASVTCSKLTNAFEEMWNVV